MGVLRVIVTVVGGMSAIGALGMLFLERNYPAPQTSVTRFAVLSVAAGLGVVFHVGLYWIDQDPQWLFAYALGFGAWAVLGVPAVALLFYLRGTRATRRLDPVRTPDQRHG